MKLSENDANSTQLEGKKLKGRGVSEGYKLGGRLLEIEEESPALQEGEPEQEIEIERSPSRESKLERDERLKREAQIAERQQLQKQPGQEIQPARDLNLQLDEREQGIILSRTKGRPVGKQEFKQDPHAHTEEHHHHHQEHKSGGIPIISEILREGEKMVESVVEEFKITDKDKPPHGSIPATKVEDVRGKDGHGLGF